MRSSLGWNYFSFFILLFILSQTYSSLKFKNKNNVNSGKNPLDSIKTDKEHIKKHIYEYHLNEQETKELSFTPISNFYDPIVTNYKEKNTGKTAFNPQIKLSTSELSHSFKEIPPNEIISSSFIDIEDNIEFIEYDHLMNNYEEEAISQLELNDFHSDNIEDLHLSMK